MNSPLVSIFIPTYNAELYIREALNSALHQDYTNYEIVISDDASTDATASILREYEEKNKDKIKLYIQEKNVGVTDNCNFILKKCKGDYICFFAGDDILSKECLSEAVKIAEEFSVCAVFHRQKLIDENGVRINYRDKNKSHIGDVRDFLRKTIYVRANGMLLKKDKIPENGYDKTLKVGSDFDFILRVLSLDGKFFYTEKELSSYRKHTKSLTATVNLESRKDNIMAYLKFMNDNPGYSLYVKKGISNIYFSMRKSVFLDVCYSVWIKNSLGFNCFNLKAWLAFFVYILSFKKIKL